MSYREQITTTADSTPIFVRRWEVSNPRSIVLVVHGYADHGGRYGGLARVLNEAGRVSSYQSFIADLGRMVAMILDDYSLPVDFFAHSFGGVQAVLYCTGTSNPRVRSVLLSSPAFRIKTNPMLQPFAGFLARIAPGFRTPGIDRTVISRDADVVRAAETDPWTYNGNVDARTGAELISAGRQALSSAPNFNLPLLAFHGSADQLTGAAATRSFVDRAASQIKSFHLLDGLFHETFNEPEKDAVYALAVSFLDRVSSG